MSTWAFAILGACIGSVISTFALVSGIVADDRRNREKHEEEVTEAYKSGVIAGSRWKEAEKNVLEEAMNELREEVEDLKGERNEQHR